MDGSYRRAGVPLLLLLYTIKTITPVIRCNRPHPSSVCLLALSPVDCMFEMSRVEMNNKAILYSAAPERNYFEEHCVLSQKQQPRSQMCSIACWFLIVSLHSSSFQSGAIFCTWRYSHKDCGLSPDEVYRHTSSPFLFLKASRYSIYSFSEVGMLICWSLKSFTSSLLIHFLSYTVCKIAINWCSVTNRKML